jgi:hypothetical protein
VEFAVVCFMHLHLMVVCVMWRYWIARYVTTDTRAVAITAHLETLGVSTKKVKKNFEKQVSENKGDRAVKRPTRPSFNGDASFAVLGAMRAFLDFTTEQQYGTPAYTGTRRQRVEDALDAYIDLLKAVAPRCEGDDEDAEDAEDGEDGEDGENARARRARTARERAWEQFWSTQAKRDAQAAVVKAKARTFVEKLASSGTPAEALGSVYIHFLTKHIVTHVARYGPLWFWSGEGLEHKNFIWKQTGRDCAQRGLAGYQNGGRKPANGAPQTRNPLVPQGRLAHTCVMVLAGEQHGGMARAGQKRTPRTARPTAMLM